MKTKHLLLLTALLLTCSLGYAQRQSATKNLHLSNKSWGLGDVDVTCTYSYIVKDGEKVYDGPVTMKGGFGTYNNISYKTWYTISGSESYTLTANNSEGFLNGPVSMKYSASAHATNGDKSVKSVSYSGNFAKGIPHGHFILDAKGDYMPDAYIDVTYNNGIFTGPFRFKFHEHEQTDVTGSFTNDGKLNGKWTISYKNRGRYDSSGTDVYEFINDVLVGGDYMNSDAAIVDISKKFGRGELTEKDLWNRNMMVKRFWFGIYDNSTNLYSDVSNILINSSLYIRFGEFGTCYTGIEGTSISGYITVREIPYLTDKGFEQLIDYMKNYNSSYGNTDIVYMPDWKVTNYNDSNHLYILVKGKYDGDNSNGEFECAGGKYWWNSRHYIYFLTKEQAAKLTSMTEAYNLEVDKKAKSLLMSKLPVHGKYRGGEVISANYYDIDREKGLQVEFSAMDWCDTRQPDDRYKKFGGHSYSTYKGYINMNGEIVVERISNKYDELSALIDEHTTTRKRTIDNIHKLANSKESHSAMWAQQGNACINYASNINIPIDHNNIAGTIELYKQSTAAMIQFVNEYLPKCEECDKLHTQIISTLNAAHKSAYNAYYTNEYANWSPNLDIAKMDKQIDILKNTVKFAEYDNIIRANELKLKEKGKSAKNVYKAYTVYSKANPVTWSRDADLTKLERIIEIQEQCLNIFNSPNAAQINTTVKKEKITDIEKIIASVK